MTTLPMGKMQRKKDEYRQGDRKEGENKRKRHGCAISAHTFLSPSLPGCLDVAKKRRRKGRERNKWIQRVEKRAVKSTVRSRGSTVDPSKKLERNEKK